MANRLFLGVSMSLDGLIAPEAVPMPIEDVFSPEGRNDLRVEAWRKK